MIDGDFRRVVLGRVYIVLTSDAPAEARPVLIEPAVLICAYHAAKDEIHKCPSDL
jgi:hypothetical protein